MLALHSRAAAKYSNSPAQIHFTLCSYSCLESADFLTNACRHAVRVLLCQYFGLIPDSGTSIQQGFASDVLVSIDVCMCRLLLHLNLMCGSASCVVTCLDLQSDTCISIVTIILMGQA